MIKIICAKCGLDLNEPGALLFTPPEMEVGGDYLGWVGKFHLCKKCYKKIIRWLNESPLDKK